VGVGAVRRGGGGGGWPEILFLERRENMDAKVPNGLMWLCRRNIQPRLQFVAEGKGEGEGGGGRTDV